MGVIKEGEQQSEETPQPPKSKTFIYIIIAIILLLIVVAVVYFMKKRNISKDTITIEQKEIEKRKTEDEMMRKLDYLCNHQNEFNKKMETFQTDTNKRFDTITTKVDNIKILKSDKRLNELEDS